MVTNGLGFFLFSVALATLYMYYPPKIKRRDLSVFFENFVAGVVLTSLFLGFLMILLFGGA